MTTKHKTNIVEDSTHISENALSSDSSSEIDDQTRPTTDSQIPKSSAIETDLQYDTHVSPTHSPHTRPVSGTGALLKTRFELLEIIGSGGMGTVYKSIDKRDVEAGNSTFIAVKVINDEFKNNPNLLKALHSEARKTQSLAHPNIVTVYDFDRDNDTVFLTMEFIDGVPLNKIIKANPLGMPNHEAIKIVTEMSKALIYAHSKDIIHLDFKPGNVLVDLNNHVKIFDFGIARVANITQFKGFDPSVLGAITPSYASLEMFKNAAPDPRDDLYALACITYELLTGQHPYKRLPANIAKQQNLKPQQIKSLNNTQWKTLQKALAFNREDRIPDIKTFLLGISETKKNAWLVKGISITLLVSTAFLLNHYQSDVSHFFTNFTTAVTPPPTVNKPLNQQRTISKPTTNNEVKHSDSINIWIPKNIYKIGDVLELSFTVDYPMFIKIISLNSEGKLITLFPNPVQKTSLCKTNTTYHIPPKNSGFTLDIGNPKGIDEIIMLASKQPITDKTYQINAQGHIINLEANPTLVQKRISYTIE